MQIKSLKSLRLSRQHAVTGFLLARLRRSLPPGSYISHDIIFGKSSRPMRVRVRVVADGRII